MNSTWVQNLSMQKSINTYMIKVLKSFDEVGEAIIWLQKKGYPLYRGVPQKNWDLFQIAQIFEELNPNNVLDMGCSGLCVLWLCHKMGIKNSFGIDLRFSLREKLTPFRTMLRERTLRLPFKLIKGDLTKTYFSDNCFDAITCLSVIEHGVELKSFLKEAGRLLRKNGVLYVSTDYWEPKICVSDLLRPFGLSWKIFSKKEIISLINLAEKFDLILENYEIPPVNKKVVFGHGKYYTFISCVFKKK